MHILQLLSTWVSTRPSLCPHLTRFVFTALLSDLNIHGVLHPLTLRRQYDLYTIGQSCNKFGWKDPPCYNQLIFCTKISDGNAKKFGYNQLSVTVNARSLLTVSKFLCIFSLPRAWKQITLTTHTEPSDPDISHPIHSTQTWEITTK